MVQTLHGPQTSNGKNPCLGTKSKADPAGNNGAVTGKVVDVSVTHQLFDTVVVGIV